MGFMVKSGIIDERNLDEFPLQYMLRSGKKLGPSQSWVSICGLLEGWSELTGGTQ